MAVFATILAIKHLMELNCYFTKSLIDFLVSSCAHKSIKSLQFHKILGILWIILHKSFTRLPSNQSLKYHKFKINLALLHQWHL